MFQAQVLYDFDGQPDSAELTIRSGDVLTVTRQDIGEGWWEGTDQRGKTGLFPAAYVEVSLFLTIRFVSNSKNDSSENFIFDSSSNLKNTGTMNGMMIRMEQDLRLL